MSIEIVSVNISKEKGQVKKPVPSITFTSTGIAEDAHAGNWHRQVSLLSKESIDQFTAMEADRDFKPGEFAENITTLGIDLTHVNLRDRFKIGGAELEVTQIGKKCHGDGCAIFKEVGKCVMPKEGVFCRVITGGIARAGDAMEYSPSTLDVRVITLSDRAFAGEYEDLSGPQIKHDLEAYFADRPWNLDCAVTLIPDDEVQLKTAIEKGIMESIRVKYGEKIPSALLSRSVAGTIGQTQIYTLPGSVKAVKEYTAEILRTLEHAIFMLHGINSH